MLNVGDPAPLFSGLDVTTGQPFNLADHQGEVVLVAFSGITWCPPCKFEAPILEDLWQEFKGNLFPKTQFVVVSVADNPAELPNSIQQFGLTMPVINSNTAQSDYQVNAVPTLFCIDKELKICAIHVGASPPADVLRNELREMLLSCGAQEPGPPINHRMWAAVAQILFGVTQDGGGVVIVGGKPIPIDPWGPLRRMPTEKLDALIALATSEIAAQLSDNEARVDLEVKSLEAAETAVRKLLARASSQPQSWQSGAMPIPRLRT